MVKKNKDILVTEAYRVLMSNIEYSSYDKPIKVIVVTSSQPGEGKTTIAKNLALAMAESGKKVVLVDCDMRRPSIHKKFKISNSTGLSEILTGQYNKIKDNYNINENIDIITSGKTPPNPVEMISSKKMDDFIELLRESYDYVIMDSPPLMAVADAQILAVKADGVVFVVRESKSKKTFANEAKNILEKKKCNILGVVFNSVTENTNAYYGDDKYLEKRNHHGMRRDMPEKLSIN